jgi:hypothetical protein
MHRALHPKEEDETVLPSEEEVAAVKALRLLFPEIVQLPEGNDEEKEKEEKEEKDGDGKESNKAAMAVAAQRLLDHTLAVGPQSCPSNMLVLHPDVGVRVWPGAVPAEKPSDSAAGVRGRVRGEGEMKGSSNSSNSSSSSSSSSGCYESPAAAGLPGLVPLSTKASLFRRLWARLHSTVTTGFHIATANGPLMHEPLEGVVFCIKSIDITAAAAMSTDATADELAALGADVAQACTHLSSSSSSSSSSSASASDDGGSSNDAGAGGVVRAAQATFSGQLISDVADALHISMLSCVDAMRVVEPVYSCSLQCDAQQVGNLYAVLSKRRGQVQDEDIIDGTTIFIFKVLLPVLESFGFSQELLKKTSGMATTPQLEFSHWQVRILLYYCSSSFLFLFVMSLSVSLLSTYCSLPACIL